jgi:hypothetical protein
MPPLVTSVMELLAVLLLILAAALFAAGLLGAPAGFAVAGVGLIVGSWIVERMGRP